MHGVVRAYGGVSAASYSDAGCSLLIGAVVGSSLRG